MPITLDRGPGRRRRAAALLVAGVLLLVPGADEATGWEVDGALRDDPRTPALTALLADARGEALATLERRFGLVPGPLPVSWELVRALRPRKGGATGGFEAGRTVILEHCVAVRVPAARYLARPGKARPVVVHEAVHALLASGLGCRSRYRAVPAWFREGLALLASGEGDARVAAGIARAVAGGRPARSVLRGLRDGAPVAPSPAEAYLAVRALETRLGDGGLGHVLAELRRGRAAEAVLAQACGLPYAALLRALERRTVRRIDEVSPPAAVRALQRAIALLGDGEPRRAREILSLVPVGRTAPALAPTWRYFTAVACMEEGEPEAAAAGFGRLLRAPGESPWEAEALAALAECRLSSGRVDVARALAGECLERFPEDETSSRRARGILRGIDPPE